MKHTRIVNSTAVDTRTESPEGFFHPDIAAQFVEVPDQVEDGWTTEGGVWSAPILPEPVEPPLLVVIPAKVSPVEFKLLFTPQERVAIKAARVSDPLLDDFYDIVEDPRLTYVDLGLASTQAALDYLTAMGLIAVGRKYEIVTGSVQ